MTGPAAATLDPADARREDRRARRLAQREFTRPLLLEAGAGTGKTTTLVARVLAWCLGPGWRRHEALLDERRRELGRDQPPAADEIASEVLERVVAITFTEDAAAEMARRAAGELGHLARPGGDEPVPAWLHLEDDLGAPERARRAAALLATLDRLVVRTIHAFCRGLLADHPLEARLHPDLSIDADGLLLEEVARETVESNLRRLYGSTDDSPYLELAGRGIGPRELVEALVVLSQAGLPAGALDADPLAPARVTLLRRRLADACAALCRLLPAHGLSHNAGAVCTAVRELDARLGGAGAHGPPASDPFGADTPPVDDLAGLLEAAAELLPRKLQDHLGKWAKSRLNKSEAAALGDRVAEVAAAAAELRALLRHLDRLDPQLLSLAHRALAPLHRQVRDEMRARGIVTFEDLLTEAARLLADRADVAAGVRGRIDQLLVDEFQDTDALQCEIVARLGLEGPREKRPGLFLVGDPKQSIYGWRSADLAAYDRFRHRVQAAGGEVLPLVENFRSVPAILDEVERAVEPVMVAEPGYQPPFQPLLPCERLAGEAGFRAPGATDGGAGGTAGAGPRRAAVEHWVSWRDDDGLPGAAERCGPATSKTHAYEVEATALARDVRHLHDAHSVGWDRFAVLLRSTTDLDLYLEALRGHGVPFAVGRDKQYYRRREVIDAAALVRCVLDPGDHLALLTVLRSPWVGVPDAALVPLWNRGFPDLLHHLAGPDPRRLRELRGVAEAAAGDLEDLAPGDVPGLARVAGWHLSLAAGCEQLALARRAFRELPADAFVDTLRRLFLPEPVAAARYLGAYRLANLERFFRRLVTALEEGGGDVTAVLRALRRSVAEAREAPEGRPREGAEDAVQVMTIHQAKGLDFSHVYLPQLHKDSGGADPATEVQPALALPAPDGADGAEDATAEAAFEVKLFGAPSLGFDRVEARRRQVEAAERVRLLYVAMTRAEHRLVLSGGWGGAAPEPREPERAGHFLDLLAHRRDLPEPPPGERWEAREAEFEDPAGALWRFPALTDWPEAATDEPSAADAPDPAAVTADSRRLEQRARRARGRMGRPFAAAASEEAHHLLREALAAGGSGVEREVGEDQSDPWHREVEIGGGNGEGSTVADPAADPGDRAGLAAAAAAAGGAEGAVGGNDGAGGADEATAAEEPRAGEPAAPQDTPEPTDEIAPAAGAALPAPTGDDERRIALTVGTAVHRWLEELDFEAEIEAEAADGSEVGPVADPGDLAALVAAAVEPGLDEAGRAIALSVTRELVGAIRGGGLLARLHHLAPHVLGREVPLLASPPEMSEDDAVDAAEAPGVPVPPVAYVSGAVDLLYRDPESGEVVVADYKTDAVLGDAVDTRARLYAPQGRVYCEALQQALGLDHRPRFELWFLRADRVVEIDLDAARSGPAWSPGPAPRPAPRPKSSPVIPPPEPAEPEAAAEAPPEGTVPTPPPDPPVPPPPADGGSPGSAPPRPKPSSAGDAEGGKLPDSRRPAEQISLFDLD